MIVVSAATGAFAIHDLSFTESYRPAVSANVFPAARIGNVSSGSLAAAAFAEPPYDRHFGDRHFKDRHFAHEFSNLWLNGPNVHIG